MRRFPLQRFCFSSFVFLLVPFSSTSLYANETAATPLEPKPEVTYGTWEGWGTSLCWWAQALGDRDDLADLLFTMKEVPVANTTLPGLGMTIVRYNAGAGSPNDVAGHRMVVSKEIIPERQMQGFWLDPKSADPESPSWDWSVDARQRSMLQKAASRGVTHLELFSNSPMWWMCANRNPSGAAKGTDDNLAPEYQTHFAVYLAEVARRAKTQWGITFTTVDPFNEPTATWWDEKCHQEGCHFSVESQVNLLPLLRRELDARGLASLEISASDESYYEQAQRAWSLYPEAVRKLVSQINVHGYEYEKGPRAALHAEATAAKKRLWNSEFGDGDADGLPMARCLTRDFRHLHPTAWCYWQPFDGGGWGLLQSDLATKTVGPVNAKYHVLAQYSRHLRPGMTVLDAGSDDAVAALDEKSGTAVLVLLNDQKQSHVFKLRLHALKPAGTSLARWQTLPDSSERYRQDTVSLAAGQEELTVELPPRSVTTLEWQVTKR